MSDQRADRYVLAVDLGTGGPKVGLVSLLGHIAWHDHVLVPTELLPDGGAEQDAEGWWTAITDASRRALAAGDVRPDQVVAMAITGQWASIVPTGEDGRPVGPCILWMDDRGGPHIRERIGGPLAGYGAKPLWELIRRTGGAPSPNGGDPQAHALFLAAERPEVHRAARWYLEPVDHLTMRCTGVASANHASLTAWFLTDNRRLDVLALDERLVVLSGIDRTKVPPIRPTCSVVGPLCATAAAELGLPTSVQVITGLPDLHTAMPGAGAIGDREAHLAISTTSWIGAHVPYKRTDIVHSIASIPGLFGDVYAIVNNHPTGGRSLQWLRDVLTEPGAEPPSYDSLTALAATSAPGSGGVLFTPWLDGERSPVDDRRARAGFHHVSLTSTRADMVRAVMEGVALNNRWLLEYVEKFAKRRLDPIRIIGGGAVSDLWCQLHADVLDRTIERVTEPLHAGIRGAAIAAGLALGEVRRDEVRALVPVERSFRPDATTRAVHDRSYGEFTKLHAAQKGLAKRLA